MPGDIRDPEMVRRAMKGVDTVFHLAALVGIPYSYHAPASYLETNVNGTYHVLQAARDLDVGNVLVMSTSETYGTAQYTPIDEKHPQVAQSPYAATKIAAEQLALSYQRSFGLPVKVAKAFNTYGPRQSARAVIPTIISQLLNGDGRLRIGSLTPTRDLTYVRDTTAALLAIARSDRLFGEVTNIGMNGETSIGDLVKTIAELIGVVPIIEQEAERIRPDASEVMQLVCDNSKLMAATSWRPAYDLRAGLLQTIGWLRAHASAYKSLYAV